MEQRMRKFKVGDVVRLKSGGPEMTVESIESLSFMGGDYNCQWFKDKSLCLEVSRKKRLSW
jgi:uncharacterized protein YodC (DUF2158 family)